MAKQALWGRCNRCNAPLREHPYDDGHRCPSGCDCPDIVGSFEYDGYVVKFSYRQRIITQIWKGDKRVRVPRPIFENIFDELKRLCGKERKTKTGPFWGPGGPCNDNPV